MSKPVQEILGAAIIGAVKDFAQLDLDDVQTLEHNLLSHVGDVQLRQILAETLYGARWIYKLGLALLVRDVEQMAHVRQQVVDYGAVCEGLLSGMIHHAIVTHRMHGTKYGYRDTRNLRDALNWNVEDKVKQLRRLSFHWHIEVAQEESIISPALANRLHLMRQERNTIHLRCRTYRAFVGTSRALYGTVQEVANRTRAWRMANP